MREEALLPVSTMMAWNPKTDQPDDVLCDPLFTALIYRLPARGSAWSADDRAEWVKTFAAIADLAHPESKPEAHVRVKIGENEAGASGSAAALVELGPLAETLNLPRSERRFVEQRPYSGSKDAASVALEMIRRAGKPGHVWYNRSDGRIRICGDDYTGEGEDEVSVGIYDVNVRPGVIIRDLKMVRSEAT